MSEPAVKCKRFVSEAEVEELKKKRQEEWEKVRKPDDPEEAPEEEYDPRSLYDRLQEQKDLKQSELEESKRLKNLIKGLDDEEVAFLELVDQTKIEMETRLWQEEKKELQEFRRAVSHVTEEEQEAKLQYLRRTLNLQSAGSAKKSQHTLLAGALKRKSSSPVDSPEKKIPSTGNRKHAQATAEKGQAYNRESSHVNEETEKATLTSGKNTIPCLGVLPGLGVYSDSSDSENVSDTDVKILSDDDHCGR